VTEEDVSELLVRYRSTVSEEPTPALDGAILRAAGSRAARVRTMRGSVVALGLAAVVIWPFWRAHVVPAPRAIRVSGYGLQEGATRYYLLTAAGVPYAGPGSMEQRQ
jgi:hypothetical protein